MEKRENEFEIDLLDLLNHLKKKCWIVLAAFLAFAVGGFLFTKLFITPQYVASTRIYVLNRGSENGLVSSDYQISNYMVSDYTVLITGRNVTSKVISELDLNISDSQLAHMISVTSPANTRILQISVTDTDPARAADIANAIRRIASEQIKEIADADAVNLVYEAVIPQAPSAPSAMKNTALAAILGVVAAVGILSVLYITDDTIRTEEDVERYLNITVMGVMPMSSDLGSVPTKSALDSFKNAVKTKKK